MDVRKEFARLAIEYAELKVPYRHRGTTRRGCDCTGLLIGIARELGFLKNYELRKYPRDWNKHAGAGNQVIEELEKFGRKISKKQATAGDIAVMFFGKCPAHCGVIINDELMMVHALSTNKCCMFGILKLSMWRSRWRETYRLDENKLRQY